MQVQKDLDGILFQKQDDNKFHLIAHYLRQTTAAEARYYSFELETYPIIYSLQKIWIYLEDHYLILKQ